MSVWNREYKRKFSNTKTPTTIHEGLYTYLILLHSTDHPWWVNQNERLNVPTYEPFFNFSNRRQSYKENFEYTNIFLKKM